MATSEFAIKNAQPKAKTYRIKDEYGLYLDVTPTGKKIWKLRYWIKGVEGKLKIGDYPLIGLKRARELRDEARLMVASGIKPIATPSRSGETMDAEERKGFTFYDVARDYLDMKSKDSRSPESMRATESRLKANIYPFVGQMLPDEISAPILLNLMRRIESKGTIETARRTLSICGQVFRYAIVTGKATRDPTGDLRGALRVPVVKHHASITTPAKVGALLRACEGYEGSRIVRIALLMTAYTFVRQGELRQMEWHEIDIGKAEWRIPAEKMKMKTPHIVPMSTQALGWLEIIRPISGRGRFVFPSSRAPAGDRCMSENTVNAAIRALGYTKEEMTAHGFRTTAATLLYESGKWSGDAIERQLAHIERNKVKAAYDHAMHLPERRKMMQWYADYLGELRDM